MASVATRQSLLLEEDVLQSEYMFSSHSVGGRGQLLRYLKIFKASKNTFKCLRHLVMARCSLRNILRFFTEAFPFGLLTLELNFLLKKRDKTNHIGK